MGLGLGLGLGLGEGGVLGAVDLLQLEVLQVLAHHLLLRVHVLSDAHDTHHAARRVDLRLRVHLQVGVRVIRVRITARLRVTVRVGDPSPEPDLQLHEAAVVAR